MNSNPLNPSNSNIYGNDPSFIFFFFFLIFIRLPIVANKCFQFFVKRSYLGLLITRQAELIVEIRSGVGFGFKIRKEMHGFVTADN